MSESAGWLVIHQEGLDQHFTCFTTKESANKHALDIVRLNRDYWEIPKDISDKAALAGWFEMTGLREHLEIREIVMKS